MIPFVYNYLSHTCKTLGRKIVTRIINSGGISVNFYFLHYCVIPPPPDTLWKIKAKLVLLKTHFVNKKSKSLGNVGEVIYLWPNNKWMTEHGSEPCSPPALAIGSFCWCSLEKSSAESSPALKSSGKTPCLTQLPLSCAPANSR